MIEVILPVLKLTDNIAGSVALGVAIPVILTGVLILEIMVRRFWKKRKTCLIRGINSYKKIRALLTTVTVPFEFKV